MCGVAGRKFLPGIRVALAAQVLEGVGCGHAAESAADLQARPLREALQEPATESITDARGIDDGAWRHRGNIDGDAPLPRRATVLAAGDDQRAGALQDRILVELRLLLHQLQFVVVADDDGRALDPVGELLPGHARALLARIPDERDAERPALFGVLGHRA